MTDTDHNDDRIEFREADEAAEKELNRAPAACDEDPFQPTPEFRQWVAGVPSLTPAEIVAEVRNLGYVGQERAARAVALAAHRHVRRIKSLFVDNVPRADLPPKQNLLFVGPTGCGKPRPT